jgi:hypothetical protein
MGNSLLLDDLPGLRPARPGTRLLARLRGASLDELLAAGRPPESSGLLAARARAIVTPRSRGLIAASYAHLLLAARRAASSPAAWPRSRAVPVCADRVLAAEPAVRELIGRLTATAPVPARGVALARVLLTDATSPVYQRRSPVSLAAALDEATAELDPARPLLLT